MLCAVLRLSATCGLVLQVAATLLPSFFLYCKRLQPDHFCCPLHATRHLCHWRLHSRGVHAAQCLLPSPAGWSPLYSVQVAKEKEQAEAEEAPTDKTRFHGKAEKDAMGRSWMDPPKDKKKESDNCFLPKRWIHTWTGHTKGVNAIR